MSSLTSVERVLLEKLLKMGGGYVLGFTNDSFQRYMQEAAGIDIYSSRYETQGDSKAKRLRTFWDLESDATVGKLLQSLLEYEQAVCDDADEQHQALRTKCAGIVDRLLGRPARQPSAAKTDEDLLNEDFSDIELERLRLEGSVLEVIKLRLCEAQICLQSKAYLSTVIMCGSILEALLLGRAQASPFDFNRTNSAPKDRDGRVRKFTDWSLGNLIDCATELHALSLDVKRFGHALREFRNYVHPYQQISSGFQPDEHTARISIQVLKAAIADLTGMRGRQ